MRLRLRIRSPLRRPGTLASELSHQPREAEEAFLGALFRNLGRLLVAFYLPEDAEQIRALTSGEAESGEPLTDAQASHKVLGVNHEQLAGHVGKSWGLPDGLLACMRSPEGRVPTRSLAARPERLWWLASMANQMAQTLISVANLTRTALVSARPQARGRRLRNAAARRADS